MTRKAFVQEMKETLVEQRRKAELERQEKSRNAEVIRLQGQKKWNELKQEVKSTVEQIAVNHVGYWPNERNSFILRSGENYLEVSCDGPINYRGVATGSFAPVVNGSELVYSNEKWQALTVEQIAETLIRIVVGKP